MKEYNWKGKTALIVDDLEINRLLLQLILEDTNLHIEFSENSKMFYEKIQNKCFDIILMDVFLNEPIITGIDLIKYLKNNNINIPVIIVSANDDLNFDVEFEGFIKKPINSKLLLKMINNILYGKK